MNEGSNLKLREKYFKLDSKRYSMNVVHQINNNKWLCIMILVYIFFIATKSLTVTQEKIIQLLKHS